jgi:alpha-tubulin suppressor-like RCC1 family protein
VKVKHISGIAKIAAGNYHSLALQSDGTLWAWGYNGSGELGNGTNGGPVNVPVAVSINSAVVEIAVGNGVSLALKNDGTVYSWGFNNEGELGNGITGGISNVPVQVFGLTSVIAIAEGTFHGLAVKSDGTVWGWGFNLYGQLGNGSNADSNVPVLATGISNAISVSGGYAHTVVLRSDGTVWSYGYNNSGQLGDGDYNNSNVPVQVSAICSVLSAVDEIKTPLNISLYPNPTENEFTLSGTKGKGTVVIYDAIGKEVFRNKSEDSKTIINTNKLQPGIFLLTYTEGMRVTTLSLSKY